MGNTFQTTALKAEHPKFVMPVLTDEVTSLRPHCLDVKGNGEIYENYQCDHLQRILFRAANRREHGNDSRFIAATKSSEDSESRYYIKNLLEFKASSATIYDTMEEFESARYRLERGPMTPIVKTEGVAHFETPKLDIKE